MQYFQCTYTIQYLLPQLHNCTHLRKKVVNFFLLKKLDLMQSILTYFFEFTFKAKKVTFTFHSKSNHDLTVKLFIGPCAIRTDDKKMHTYVNVIMSHTINHQMKSKNASTLGIASKKPLFPCKEC